MVGIGADQQPGQESAHRCRLLRFEHRSIALRRELHGIKANECGYDNGHRCACGHADRMPAHELGRAIDERIGARADRLVRQVALQIAGERGDRRITFCGRLLERFEDDRVEIASQGLL